MTGSLQLWWGVDAIGALLENVFGLTRLVAELQNILIWYTEKKKNLHFLQSNYLFIDLALSPVELFPKQMPADAGKVSQCAEQVWCLGAVFCPAGLISDKVVAFICWHDGGTSTATSCYWTVSKLNYSLEGHFYWCFRDKTHHWLLIANGSLNWLMKSLLLEHCWVFTFVCFVLFFPPWLLSKRMEFKEGVRITL